MNSLCRFQYGIQIVDFKWFTTSLIPAFSPRRRRIVLRLLGNSRDWICRTLIRKTKTGPQLFLLLGEKAGMRADVKYKFHPTRLSTPN